MALKTEARHDEEFLVSEANGDLSRQKVTIALGENLTAGMVVGEHKAGAAAAAAFAGNTGDGAMGAITEQAGIKAGVYKLVIIEPAVNAGAFEVYDPDGKLVGTGNVAAVFTGGGLSFTLADGAADFVAGDGFDITVAVGDLEWIRLDLTDIEGADVAAGVLLRDVDASAAAAEGAVLVRDATINAAEIIWPVGFTGGQIATGTAELAALGIIAR